MKFEKPEHQQPSYFSKRYNWRQKPALPLDKDILLYPRVSGVGQLDNVSTELQMKEDGELLKTAHELGWLSPSEWTPGCGKGKIRQFPQDMAVSGRLRMEERTGFKLMLQAIISGEAGAVLCIEVDRLFRDKYGQEAGKFMEICEKYGVIVITPRQIYDFHNSSDVSDFKEDAARAWDYMQRQIYDKLIYAQNFLSETGRVGRGQRISIGYILDTDKKSPTFRHLIPYPPHAEIKRNLYERYRELGDNMGKLYRELRAKPFVFPDFPEDFPPRHAHAVNLLKVPGGWTIGSRSGFTRMMCDTVNIGWMRHGKDVVRDEAGNPKVCHEPIVPEDLFWYVFKSHSSHLPDGSLNPATQKWRDRQRIEAIDAMLRLVISSVDPASYHVIASTQTKDGKRTSLGNYSFYSPKATTEKGNPSMYASIGAREVDRVFWQLLMPRLEATRDIENYADQEAAAFAQKEHEHKEILAQIEACDSAIVKQQAKLLKVDSDALITAINEEVHRQLEEKARLQSRLQTFLEGDTKHAEQMKEWNKLVISGLEEIMKARIRAERDKQPLDYAELVRKLAKETVQKQEKLGIVRNRTEEIESRQQLALTFAPEVTLELLSPRVLRMVIHWRVPDWKCEEAVWLSVSSHGPFWQDEERARFLAMIGQVSPLELMQAFPNRSWRALTRQAHVGRKLGLLPVVGPLSSERGSWHDTVCWQDWPYVQQYGLTPAELYTATIACPEDTLCQGSL
jgi:hypothetical protein